MKERIKSRKGVAIEMAILLIVVVFALSTLIVSVSLSQQQTKKVALTAMKENILLEQIGEDFCHAVTAGTVAEWTFDCPPEYEIKTDAAQNLLTVTQKDSGDILLLVRVEPDDDNPDIYRIAEWRE